MDAFGKEKSSFILFFLKDEIILERKSQHFLERNHQYILREKISTFWGNHQMFRRKVRFFWREIVSTFWRKRKSTHFGGFKACF